MDSFSFIFSLFQTNNTILTTNQCEKCPSSIQCKDSNPQPLKHELSPITTRPGLLHFGTSLPCIIPNKLLSIISSYCCSWFALMYMCMVFFIIPLYIFGLSLAGPIALYIGVLPILSLAILVVILNVLQAKIPNHLPDALRTWEFLPLWMRSLEPMDR